MADVDIKENEILKLDRRILSLLLKDNSSKYNIIWATDNYVSMGVGFEPTAEMTIDAITGDNGLMIRPRIAKSKEEQICRVRDKAEVFTPAWMCNCQNNLIDNAWFGEEGIFNSELVYLAPMLEDKNEAIKLVLLIITVRLDVHA